MSQSTVDVVDTWTWIVDVHLFEKRWGRTGCTSGLPNSAFAGPNAFAKVGAKHGWRSIHVESRFRNNKGWANTVSAVNDCRHTAVLRTPAVFDNGFNCSPEDIMVETTSIIAEWYLPEENLVDHEYVFGQFQIGVDAFVHRLLFRLQDGRCTIPSSPSMIAINPPVLVPPIKSKYSQGLGVSEARVRCPMSSIISRKIKREDNPRTPPPSNERTRGVCPICEASTRISDVKQV